MDSYAVILRGQSGRIADGVIEANDLDGLEAAVQGLVEDLADCMERGGVIEPGGLVAALQDHTAVARVLRSILFEGIEAFRRELEPPAFNEAVLGLRACIHPAVHRPNADSEDRAFFGQLLNAGQLEEECEESRLVRLFHDLAVTSHDIVYVHDLNGTMLYVNKPGLDLTKFTVEEVVEGISIYDFITPEYLEIIESRMESPGIVSRAPYCSEIYTKDGDRVPMEITTRTLVRNGKLAGVMGVARDLRLARRLESEIRRAHAELDTLLANIPSGVVLTDGLGVVMDANRVAVNLLGASSEGALIGAPLFRLCGDDGGDLYRAHEKALASGERVVVRCSQASAFGAQLHCEMAVVPYASECGCINAAMVIMSDVSRESLPKDHVSQVGDFEILGKTLGGLAHELNNPLTGILGYGQLLLGAAQDSQVRSRVESVISEAGRCREIVENLLRFSSMQGGGRSMQDVNNLISDILTLIRYRLRTEQIETRLELEPNLPPVRINPCDLQRALLHMFTNARQALTGVADRPRRLFVRTRALEECVEIRIGDNGPGIPADVRPRIFDRFFTTRAAEKAAGLGLSIVSEVIRGMGGDIKLAPAEETGAVFSITLPIPEKTADSVIR